MITRSGAGVGVGAATINLSAQCGADARRAAGPVIVGQVPNVGLQLIVVASAAHFDKKTHRQYT
jgi:hypothetical protein